MQPYFLPYIGYWQLIAGADRFVLLDDVNYINRGWVNRNRIWLGGAATWLTVPLSGASQNRKICEIDLVADDAWKTKASRLVESAYRGAPCWETGGGLFEDILSFPERNLASFLRHSLAAVASLLGLGTDWLSSRDFGVESPDDRGSGRIRRICRELGATHYTNPIGGTGLYETSAFQSDGVELGFLRTEWEQLDLVSGSTGCDLSILDLLMHNPLERVRQALSACRIVSAEVAAP